MDEGWVLRVCEAGERIRVGTDTITFEYEGLTEPNHTCGEPRRLQADYLVTVKKRAPTSVLVSGPCGCEFLLWGLIS